MHHTFLDIHLVPPIYFRSLAAHEWSRKYKFSHSFRTSDGGWIQPCVRGTSLLPDQCPWSRTSWRHSCRPWRLLVYGRLAHWVFSQGRYIIAHWVSLNFLKWVAKKQQKDALIRKCYLLYVYVNDPSPSISVWCLIPPRPIAALAVPISQTPPTTHPMACWSRGQAPFCPYTSATQRLNSSINFKLLQGMLWEWAKIDFICSSRLNEQFYVFSVAVSHHDVQTELLSWDPFPPSSDPPTTLINFNDPFQGDKIGLKRMGTCDKVQVD